MEGDEVGQPEGGQTEHSLWNTVKELGFSLNYKAPCDLPPQHTLKFLASDFYLLLPSTNTSLATPAH